jgi:hypothetical protein
MQQGNKKTRAIAVALSLAEEFIEAQAEAPDAGATLTAIRSALRFLPSVERRKPHQNSYHRRVRPDPEYKAWIASLPCAVPDCSTGDGVEVAHIGDRGLSNRCPDRQTGPFCTTHHRDDRLGMHGRLGKNYWKHYGLNRDELIAELNRKYDLQHC